MEKKQTFLHLIFAVLFIGLVLSCSVFFLTETWIMRTGTQAEDCYDGSVIEGDSFFARFSRTVYQNKNTLSFIAECEYRFFDVVTDPNVIVGDEGFLFEARNAETGYDYLRDFIGEESFTEEECAAILAELQRREDFYATRGAEYFLIIIPNAQTVYSDYMPSYLGEISPNTRLSVLDRYLQSHGFDSFSNITSALRRHTDKGLLYNNTENSLNARGLYYTYLTVYSYFSEPVRRYTDPILPSEVTFFEHMTQGKDVARRAGLADVVQNRTVSLSNDTDIHYRYLFNTGRCVKTVRIDYSMNQVASPPLLLQFTSNWERSQIEPFFSNTFTRVTYQTSLEHDETVYEQAKPAAVIQFIYESDLSSLLP